MSPIDQIIQELNALFITGNKPWTCHKATEKDPSNGSSSVFIYIKYSDEEYSDFMTIQQTTNYKNHIILFGTSSIQKPVFTNNVEEKYYPQPQFKKNISHLKLVVNNENRI